MAEGKWGWLMSYEVGWCHMRLHVVTWHYLRSRGVKWCLLRFQGGHSWGNMRSNSGQINHWRLAGHWRLHRVTDLLRCTWAHMRSHGITKVFMQNLVLKWRHFFAPVPPRHFLTFATCASFLLALLFAQHCLFAWTSVTLIMPYRNDL